MSPSAYQYTAQYSQYTQYSHTTAASATSTSQSHAGHDEWKNNSSWQSPTAIDDNDLMFDGKPLNLLHEENQSRMWAGGDSNVSFSLSLYFLLPSSSFYARISMCVCVCFSFARRKEKKLTNFPSPSQGSKRGRSRVKK